MTTSRSRQLGDGEKPKAIEPTEVFSPGSEHHIDAAEVERLQREQRLARAWAQEEACRRAGVVFGGSTYVDCDLPPQHNRDYRSSRPGETVEVRVPVRRDSMAGAVPPGAGFDPRKHLVEEKKVYMSIEDARKLGIRR